ncbi:MAG: OmpH family outer membrane protein [Bacteroidia bacterium]|jgi:outer membrane protein|nr:OmpH family outer membrane protein [Bacteroidia bacterium]
MKNVVFTVLAIIFISMTSVAQKTGFVDTDYILSRIPEYKAAQAEIDKTSVDWQKEIELKYSEIDKLYKIYKAESVLLTDDMKKKRENEIINKEKEAKELQKSRFGVDGELFKKRMELVKPIQDKVFSAVKQVAEKSGLAFIFDKAGQVSLLYSNSKYDKSEDVLTFMGYNKK